MAIGPVHDRFEEGDANGLSRAPAPKRLKPPSGIDIGAGGGKGDSIAGPDLFTPDCLPPRPILG